ncbi:MAG: immunoglobulin-like domain-containing protein, partial [Limisphaerales bacterium]
MTNPPTAGIVAPSSATKTGGTSQIFTVTFTGDPVTYQWRKNGGNMVNASGRTAGATTANLTVSNIQTSDNNATYDCVLANYAGSTTSSGATLAVQYTITTATLPAGNAASVTAAPSQSLYNDGTSVQLTANPPSNFAFQQWTINGSVVSGNPTTISITTNTTATAVFTNVTAITDIVMDNDDPTNAVGNFNVSFKPGGSSWTFGNSSSDKFGNDYRFGSPTGNNTAGVNGNNGTSGISYATATYSPVVTTPGTYDLYVTYPEGTFRTTNAPYTIKSGSVSNTFRINQQTGGGVSGGTWHLLGTGYFPAGAPSPSVVIIGNNCSTNGGAGAVIADGIKLVYSTNTQQAGITGVTGPTPSGATSANYGDTVTWSVTSDPNATSYQWKKGGNNLSNGGHVSGATTTSLILTGVDSSDKGSYSCTVGNSINSVDSSTVTLTVHDPIITQQPTNTTVSCGSDAVFSVTATGSSPFTYQWYTPNTSGTKIAGAQSDTLTVTNVHAAGSYQVVVSNSLGAFTASSAATVSIIDTVAPVITLNGATDVTVECHGSFSDPGATSTDACDGVHAIAAPTSGSADLTTVGDYVVTYTASDNAGNPGNSVTRNIHVRDTGVPTINLVGPVSTNVECHVSWSDPSATASDICDANPVVSQSSMSFNTPGTFTRTYTATDGSGNSATATREIIVQDTVPPVITLTGGTNITAECHQTFTDPGASAADACDASASVNFSGSVNTNSLGSYTLTYTSTDAANNTATEYRTVTVIDTVPPLITVNSGPSTICVGDPYTDPSASATDACVGSVSVGTIGAVNSSVAGNYTVTYTATDGVNSTNAIRVVS